MSYTDLQYLSATEFKRLCGVRRETFNAPGRGAATTIRASRSEGRTEQATCGRSTVGDIGIRRGNTEANFI